MQEINLYSLRAYFHPEYDDRFGPIERLRESLSDDCPLFRLFQSIIASHRGVVKIAIKAEFTRPDDVRILPAIWSSLISNGRELLAKLGRIKYCPLSRIAVTPYCMKDDSDDSTGDSNSGDFDELPPTYLNALIDPAGEHADKVLLSLIMTYNGSEHGE